MPVHDRSRYSTTGHTQTVIFTLTAEQFAQIRTGDHVTVLYGTGGDGRGWNFGPVDKNMLR